MCCRQARTGCFFAAQLVARARTVFRRWFICIVSGLISAEGPGNGNECSDGKVKENNVPIMANSKLRRSAKIIK